MSASPTSDELVGLCHALAGVLSEVCGGAAKAGRGARAVLPAVLSLPVLGVVPGEIHRRCRLTWPDAGPAAALEAFGSPVVAGERTVRRAGWQLRQVDVNVGQVQITHWLARNLDGARAERDDRPAAGGATNRGSQGDRGLGGVVSTVRVAAWAQASGDPNPVHLVPGAGRRAGLSAGRSQVVAHGLMLGALSAAWVPGQGRLDLRVPAPLGMEEQEPGVQVDVDARGDLWHEGVRVLAR